MSTNLTDNRLITNYSCIFILNQSKLILKMIETRLEIIIDEIKYGTDKVILKNIKLDINQNGLYGFFGKNGQGKSTFLKALCGLKSFEGKINLNQNILKPSEIAFIATEPNLYEYLTAEEFYTFYQKVSGREDSQTNVKLFDINEKILLKAMSTGTLKKAYINTILQFNDYKLYIFDEPFNGLDIESNYILIQKIKKLAENNIVLISSHIIEIIAPFLMKTFYVNNQSIIEIENQNLNELFMNNYMYE